MRNKFKVLAIVMLVLFIAANALAITISVTRSYKIDRESAREGTIDFDSSYPTGGEVVNASDFKLSNKIRWLEVHNRTDASGNFKIFEYRPASGDASGNLKVYDASLNVSQVANGSSLSNLTGVKFKVFGY